MKYNHAYSVSFSVVTDEEDPYAVSLAEMIKALAEKLKEISTPDPYHGLAKTAGESEAFDCWDTYTNAAHDIDTE